MPFLYFWSTKNLASPFPGSMKYKRENRNYRVKVKYE